MTPLPRTVATGVQKAPRHGVAGSLALAVQRALWGFDGGAELEGRVDVTATGCGLHQPSRLATLLEHTQ
jgi:hypothetical protein